LGAPAFR
jgi:uncharacterized protein (UPF0335 family)